MNMNKACPSTLNAQGEKRNTSALTPAYSSLAISHIGY